jgi:superfamily II helicase
MSLYHYAQPFAINRTRDHTENHKKMAGVTAVSFLCKKCNQPKKTTGRKSLGHKQGFICADCAKIE